MVKETARKCSHCGHNGHNSRTCNVKGGGIKLFGVNIGMDHNKQDHNHQQHSMKKSVSMGNLVSTTEESKAPADESGYLSDGQIQYSKKSKMAHERKKGKPWTAEEHRIFLAGLKSLGKGDWRGIAKNFVTTRTPTQVASHAQKYFLRQASHDKKKRRSSLFDMHLKEYDPILESLFAKENSKISSSLSANTPSQIATRFPHLCLDDRPVMSPTLATAIPSYHGIQYVKGGDQSGQNLADAKVIQSMSFVPTMNYARQGYNNVQNMQKSLGNVATCAPIAHPSGIPSSPRSVPHSLLRSSIGHGASSLAGKDPLELKIGPPQPSKNTSLPSHQSSGAISVI